MPSSQNWTFCRAFSPLNVAHVSNSRRPTLRAGKGPARRRWTRPRLLVRAALDSAPLPARSPGRGAFHAPRFICQVLGHLLVARASSDDRLPPQSTDQPGGWCSGLGCGLNALAPCHALRSCRGSPTSALALRLRASRLAGHARYRA